MSAFETKSLVDVKIQNKFVGGESITGESYGLNAEFNQYLEFYLQKLSLEENKRILIVEDDEYQQKYLGALVTSFDCNIQCQFASSVKEAVELSQRNQYALFIVDYALDGTETGIDFYRQIRNRAPDAGWVVISGIEAKEYSELTRTISSPPVFLQKPVPSGQIIEQLQRVLGAR